jgi:hypothetical protein
MKRFRAVFLGLTAIFAMAAEGRAGDEADLRRLVGWIDRELEKGWRESGVEPAGPADDATFLRRVRLDLTGTIPTASEAREFLADPDPDKRRKLVDRLLAGPAFTEYFTEILSATLLPDGDAGINGSFARPVFAAWLRKQIAEGAGYDAIVREILTLDPGSGRGGVINPYDASAPVTPVQWYLARETKPENLAAATTRTFLGIRLECAQCHDHPFESWKREEFWEQAAFFAGYQATQNGGGALPAENLTKRELTIPETKIAVRPRLLGEAAEAKLAEGQSPRRVLAAWVTGRDNPYFARATANRMWAHFLGTGLIEPVDDLSPSNPASHPAVLDELALQFAGRGFDLKYLARVLTSTRAYQLSSSWTGSSAPDPQLFARMRTKGLTGSQVVRAYRQASGLPADPVQDRRFSFSNSSTPGLAALRDKFRRSGTPPAEAEESILQALALMNGGLTATATDPARGATLSAVIGSPFLDDPGRIEALFLTTLGRPASDRERKTLLAAIGGSEDPPKTYADLFWSLLNSPEFLVNH